MRHPDFRLLTTLALAATASGAAAQVPAEFQGTWVPAKATCEAPARVVIAADQLTLMNGSDKQAIGEIEMAGPGYWGPDYHGIMAVLITEFSGQQPVTASFNVGEKKGVAEVEFAPVMPGGNPQQTAYNKRITQLNLAKRFPLNKVPLKKCAAGAGAGGESSSTGAGATGDGNTASTSASDSSAAAAVTATAGAVKAVGKLFK